MGAYLTQNTAWTNVEKALANLRSARVLSVNGIRQVRLLELERLIRPAGYFRQKARRLKIFVAFLDRQYAGSLTKMFACRPTAQLREELLELNGVGPETADSILLYAGNHPLFVIDAYTRRILARHAISPDDATYEDARQLCESSLAPLAGVGADSEGSTQQLAGGFPNPPHPPSRMSAARRTELTQIYNEMHGLIVGVGKKYCKKSQPHCDGCPLQTFLPALK